MINKNVLSFILLSLYMTKSIKIEVDYDNRRDLIYMEGKMYISIESLKERGLNGLEHSFGRSLNELEEELPVHCEEDLVTGAAFWFYLIFILCNYTFNFSFNLLCWFDVWVNCWLPFNR